MSGGVIASIIGGIFVLLAAFVYIVMQKPKGS